MFLFKRKRRSISDTNVQRKGGNEPVQEIVLDEPGMIYVYPGFESSCYTCCETACCSSINKGNGRKKCCSCSSLSSSLSGDSVECDYINFPRYSCPSKSIKRNHRSKEKTRQKALKKPQKRDLHQCKAERDQGRKEMRMCDKRNKVALKVNEGIEREKKEAKKLEIRSCQTSKPIENRYRKSCLRDEKRKNKFCNREEKKEILERLERQALKMCKRQLQSEWNNWKNCQKENSRAMKQDLICKERNIKNCYNSRSDRFNEVKKNRREGKKIVKQLTNRAICANATCLLNNAPIRCAKKRSCIERRPRRRSPTRCTILKKRPDPWDSGDSCSSCRRNCDLTCEYCDVSECETASLPCLSSSDDCKMGNIRYKFFFIPKF